MCYSGHCIREHYPSGECKGSLPGRKLPCEFYRCTTCGDELAEDEECQNTDCKGVE